MAYGCFYISSQNRDRAAFFRCLGTNKAPGTEIKSQGEMGKFLLLSKMAFETLNYTYIRKNIYM